MNEIILGDCLDIIKSIPDNSIDLVFTDPPYNVSSKNKIFRDYRTGKNGDVSMDYGDWDYEFDPVSFLQETRRVLKNTGQWIIFTSEQLYPTYRLWFDELIDPLNSPTKNGYFKQLLIWHKTNPIPEFRLVKYRQATELMVWALKEKHPKKEMHFNFLKQQEMTNVFSFPICGGNERKPYKHPTQKPLALAADILKRHTMNGDVVLDPFCGVGTIPVACKNLGLNYIGIEINDDYYNKAVNRLNQIQSGVF